MNISEKIVEKGELLFRYNGSILSIKDKSKIEEKFKNEQLIKIMVIETQNLIGN